RDCRLAARLRNIAPSRSDIATSHPPPRRAIAHGKKVRAPRSAPLYGWQPRDVTSSSPLADFSSNGATRSTALVSRRRGAPVPPAMLPHDCVVMTKIRGNGGRRLESSTGVVDWSRRLESSTGASTGVVDGGRRAGVPLRPDRAGACLPASVTARPHWSGSPRRLREPSQVRSVPWSGPAGQRLGAQRGARAHSSPAHAVPPARRRGEYELAGRCRIPTVGHPPILRSSA